MSGSLVADPSALIGLGWAPRLSTRDGLRGLMQETALSRAHPDTRTETRL
jgi:hypothetical protein